MKKILATLAVVASLILPQAAFPAKPAALRKKQVKIYSRINIPEDRTVVLKGSIYNYRTDPVVEKLIDLDEKGKPILLIINSPGGSMVSGDRLITTMKALDSKVICIVDGEAYSMAAIISLQCDKLYATENADFMFHQASLGAGGSLSIFKSRSAHWIKWIETYELDIAKKLGLSFKSYKAKIHNEWWMTAREAVEYGLVYGLIRGIKYKTPEENNTFWFFWDAEDKNKFDPWLCGPTDDENEPCFYHQP